MSEVTPLANRFTRGLRWTRLTLHIVGAAALAGLIFPRVSVQRRARLSQRWSAHLLRLLNIELAVHGARPDANVHNVMIAANHVSWLDIFVINAAHPSLFVAKSEIRDWPVAGWLCERAGTIFVRRAKRSDAARTNDDIHEALSRGATVAFFPEGTTTAGDSLHKFHTSLFEPAVANAASLSPTVIRYRRPDGSRCVEASYFGDIGFSDSIRQIIAQKSITATITFAAPINAVGLPRRTLAAQSEMVIAATLGVPLPDAHQRFPIAS